MQVRGSLGYDDLLAGERFDLVVSNIPAKVGGDALRHLLLDARAHLAPERPGRRGGGRPARAEVDDAAGRRRRRAPRPAPVEGLHRLRVPLRRRGSPRSRPAASSAGCTGGAARRSGSATSAWEADVSYSLPEFDSVGRGTQAAVELLTAQGPPPVRGGAVAFVGRRAGPPAGCAARRRPSRSGAARRPRPARPAHRRGQPAGGDDAEVHHAPDPRSGSARRRASWRVVALPRAGAGVGDRGSARPAAGRGSGASTWCCTAGAPTSRRVLELLRRHGARRRGRPAKAGQHRRCGAGRPAPVPHPLRRVVRSRLQRPRRRGGLHAPLRPTWRRPTVNVAILRGRLSSPPRTLELASGDAALALEVTVRDGEAPAESVPVAWFAARSAAAGVGRRRRGAGRRRAGAASLLPGRRRHRQPHRGPAPTAVRPGAERKADAPPPALEAAPWPRSRRGCDRCSVVGQDGEGDHRRHGGAPHEPGAAREGPRPARASSPPSTRAAAARPKALQALRRRRGRVLAATTRCSTASTRCAPGSSPARASAATASSGRSCSRDTMDRQIEGRDTADYLWAVKRRRAVPEGRQGPGRRGRRRPGDEADRRASTSCSRGPSTRACSAPRCARSSSWPTPAGVEAVVDQQFEVGRQILAAGLVPIIEPEVDIHSPQKAEAEALLKAAILAPARRRRPTTSR